MSFLKKFKQKLTPPKAKITLSLAQSSVAVGEDLEGTISVVSEEDFDAVEIRYEIQCVEMAKKLVTVYDENLKRDVQREVWDSAAVYQAKPTVSGQLKIANGYADNFPFKTNIPPGRKPTQQGLNAKVIWTIKGVIAVDGRPDVTSDTVEIQIVPASAVPIVKKKMIPCEYCGTLVPETEVECSNCGAPRKA